MTRPAYTTKPIGSISALAQALRVNESVLINYANQHDVLYDEFSVEKKDGSPRNICSPKKELKFIQKRINRVIFDNVNFPEYLYGGIKGKDYVKNAALHANAEALIALDIENFYPSIKSHLVKKVFKNFCRFPDDVAEILTKLTTLNGAIPQGACTSSNIANLVFFDAEHLLVSQLFGKGFRYSRLIDDISISFDRRAFGKKEQEAVIKNVSAMLSMHGMRLKKKKTRVSTRSNPADLMEITGLWVNRGQPRIKRQERTDIRKELRQVFFKSSISRTAPLYHEAFDRVSGKVGKLAHLQHAEAIGARRVLRQILPHLDVNAKIHLARQVKSLTKVSLHRRGTIEYIQKFYKVIYQINILKRTDKSAAQMHEDALRGCYPTRSMEDIIYG